MGKEINIMGHVVTVQYNMATQIAYEEIMNTPFDVSAFEKSSNMLALFYACVVANNPQTKLTFDDLMLRATAADITLLRNAVVESFTEWCEGALGDEKKEAAEGSGEKKS